MRLDRCSLGLMAVVAIAATPPPADAQGFGLNEIGTCAMARGFAATGAPCADASVLFWNPAAATTLPGITLYAGAAAVALNGDFTADFTARQYDADVPTEVPPHVFLNYARDRLALGVGAYVPYGLTSQWTDSFPGRFAALKASLATVYVQPNIAYQVVPGRVSVGGGPIIGYSDVELRQALDLSTAPTGTGVTFGQLGIAPGTEFGRAKLEGDAFGYGFHVGVHIQATSHLQIGARYLSEIKFSYDDADATFTQTPTNLVLNANLQPPLTVGTPVDPILAGQFTGSGALTSQKVKTEIKHPSQLAIGAGYTYEGTTVSLDYQLIGWSSFDRLPVNFEKAPDRSLIEDYKNAWAIRSGLQHVFQNGLALRGGISFAKTPAPPETVTPLLPDQDRSNYSLGVGIPFGSQLGLDIGFLAVDTQGRRGRIVERTSADQTAAELNSGFYRLNAYVYSASLKARF
jgi:long-chain fatty acid transport protein